MKKTLFFTNIFPAYRKKIWFELLTNPSFLMEIYYCSKPLNGIPSLPKATFPTLINHFEYLSNYSIKGIIFWQSKVIKNTLFSSFDKALFLGEMNIISTWISALVCRIRGKEVIFWSHGLYGNESTIKSFVRSLFYKLANTHLVYENRGKKRMIQKGFHSEKIKVIYNSLDYELHKHYFDTFESKIGYQKSKLFKNHFPVIFFIGRLTATKKIDQLVDALLLINKESPRLNLLIIGEGPERQAVENKASYLIKKGLCRFEGAIFDEAEIAPLIYSADLCVSPGNIGLTAIHALSYGVPVCTHRNFNNQMPEAEAIIEFENGILFEENNIQDLVDKIKLWFSKYHEKYSKTELRRIVEEYYNHNYQIKVFKSILR